MCVGCKFAAFYRIFLCHDHRQAVGKFHFSFIKCVMVRKSMSHDNKPCRLQQAEKAARIAYARDCMNGAGPLGCSIRKRGSRKLNSFATSQIDEAVRA
jgi:hypothetical protein